MPTLLQTVQAIAWPALLIFLALKFQDPIVELIMRRRRSRTNSGAGFPGQREPGLIDAARIRQACRDHDVGKCTDAQLAQVIWDSVLSREDLLVLNRLATVGPEPTDRLDGTLAPPPVLAGLAERKYVEHDPRGTVRLSQSGLDILRLHLNGLLRRPLEQDSSVQ